MRAPIDPRHLPVSVGDFVYRQKHVPRFVGARGAYLFDDEGRRYLDAEASNGATLLGYDETILREACERMAGLPSLPSFCESELRLRVAARLVEMLGGATGESGRVAFSLGGAQGIELAMRVVRGTRPEGPLAVFEGGYHGRSIYTAELSAAQRYRTAFPSVAERVVRLPYGDCAQCRFGRVRASCAHECVSFVKTGLRSEVSGFGGREAQVAALIVEPFVSAGGTFKPDRVYLEETVHAFRERGALIVVDETFTGLYRTGTRWGFEHYAFTPDLVVFAKGLTNGLVPLSCVWARDPLMLPPAFPPGSHSSTFSNNIMALAVADVVLDRLDAWEGRAAQLAELESALVRLVAGLASRSSLVESGSALGAVARLLLKPGLSCGTVMDRARTIAWSEGESGGPTGVILAGSGLADNVVALNPALSFDREAFRHTQRLLEQTFDALEREEARR